MMEGFRKNYAVYYSVLFITGLWPFDQSLRSKILRTVFSVVILYCIGIQISTLRLVDMSVYNIVMVLSYGCPMLLYFLRYMGFVVNFPIVSTLKLVETSLYNSLQVLSFTFPLLLFLFRYVGFITSFPIVKFVFDSVEYDYVATKDPIEADLFTKQIEEARQVVTALVVLAVAEIFSLCVLLLVPTLLQSNLQIHYLHFFGFLYPERSTQTDWASVQVIIVTSLGLLAIACTESSLAVFVAYLCGLLEIASYRLRTVVDEMANSAAVPSNVIDVGPAMELHQRAVELVPLLRYYSNVVAAYFTVHLFCLLSRP